ncbi:MAG: hypothetical protein U1E45_06145 [Geminicoccaceae bacterium]
MRRLSFKTMLLACATTMMLPAAAVAYPEGVTQRVSVGPGGVQANGASSNDSIGVSASLRYIAYSSAATNLVAQRTSGSVDVYYTDLAIGRTLLVSRSWDGRRATGPSLQATMTPDGRYVAFLSLADNLVPGDTNHAVDVFLRNMRTGKTELVSLGTEGRQGNSHSFGPAISADGRYVAFYSLASNLVANDTNGALDVFVRDRLNATTTRVSVGPGGVQGNGTNSIFPLQHVAMSADGGVVAFLSDASNLVPGDTNGTLDVFARDLVKGTTELVSRSNNKQADSYSVYPSLSVNGRFVAFASEATNIVPKDTNGVADIFVRDRKTQTTRRVNLGPDAVQANGESALPTISPDGTMVAYASIATNLVAGDTNGFVDIFSSSTTDTFTVRNSIAYDLAQGNGNSISQPAVTARGRFVVYSSEATNLVPGDTNGVADIFVHLPF